MTLKVELVPILTNLAITGFYIYKGDEFGKILYWLGGTIVITGVYFMKG